MICNKVKKINSITKSKLDWKKMIKKEKIADKLSINRKKGYIDR